MDAKTSLDTSPKKPRSIHSVILIFLSTLCAELILHIEGVVPEPAFSFIGRVVIIFLCLYAIHRFALQSLTLYKPKPKDMIALSLMLIGSFVLVRLGWLMSESLVTQAETSVFFNPLSTKTMHYAIPYAAGALLLQSVLGFHYGMVFSLSFAVILGIYAPSDSFIIPYVLSTCFVACLSLSRFRSRSAYIKAGFNVAIIALPFALASVVIDGTLTATEFGFRIFAAFMGGALCTFVAAGVTPIIETIGGYVTDMRLIEMATIDHPLLKELSIQVPGTWNHSMVMGMMAEAAADEVGANAVLARVGAYFHDVGKTKKPAYFVENQGGGENRHDKLSTSMSALIIRSHVKDGMELAKKHKLPQAIIDMIPQHHGTSVIGYFYEKACKEAEEAGEDAQEVDKSLYSYPGPKPQTKEAGILMLADGIEAAARTLSDPSLDRIQGMVQKMINKVFASGQLSECDLTLQDLHLIAKSFTRILCSIYHQRIAYAEPAEKVHEKADKKASKKETQKAVQEAVNEKKESAKEPKKNGKKGKKKTAKKANKQEETTNGAKAVADSDTAKESKDESEEVSDSKDSKEDLKRLGL